MLGFGRGTASLAVAITSSGKPYFRTFYCPELYFITVEYTESKTALRCCDPCILSIEAFLFSQTTMNTWERCTAMRMRNVKILITAPGKKKLKAIFN